jgi:drug/metabolite transporter (DMT)-like permease
VASSAATEVVTKEATKEATKGLLYGFLGIVGFSVTLPATKLAVVALDPLFVGLGRALVAACMAAPLLYFTRQKKPTSAQIKSLFIVMLGVIIGFPLLTAWAMQSAPASHGAVVVGLLPLATALAGAWRAHERPSRIFWYASIAGSVTVVGYALANGGGSFHTADFILLAAVAAAALGYAEGGRLAREIGGWQVICWALVLAAPLLIIPTAFGAWRTGLEGFANAPASAWAGFAYVAAVSQFLGFFAWYHGLALGGVARVGQVQLLQPFMTLGFSAVLLGEKIAPLAIVAMSVAALAIFVGRRWGTVGTAVAPKTP